MEEEKREVAEVVAGLIWDDQKVLAVKRPVGKPMEGYWEFPGGKVEDGETLGQALTRELAEELAVEVIDFDLWREKRHSYDHTDVKLYFFLIRSYRGRPEAREGQEYKWVLPKEAQASEFLEADREILDVLKSLQEF